MDQITIRKDGNMLYVEGELGAGSARTLLEHITGGTVFTLDFDKVSAINFAALRALLTHRRKGYHFCVINASDAVAEKFEDTGVSVFVNVCRKPKPLKIGRWDEFGGGFLSKAFNSDDGDSIIKVYDARVPKWLVAQEKAIARAVMVFGIPTPLVGTLYEDGEKTALDFEKIEGKRSFSRIISEEPERLEEMTVRFARMCRKLHSTQCDTSLFSDRSAYYRKAVEYCKEISDEEKAKALAFIDSLPSATTCLHGDMQLSNVITNGEEDLWIDLSDFGYGNPMLDLGMWYFLSNLAPERISQEVFHLGKDTMRRVWDVFAREYFDADSPQKMEKANREVIPFAALHMLYLGSCYGFDNDDMLIYIRENLLS